MTTPIADLARIGLDLVLFVLASHVAAMLWMPPATWRQRVGSLTITTLIFAWAVLHFSHL